MEITDILIIGIFVTGLACWIFLKREWLASGVFGFGFFTITLQGILIGRDAFSVVAECAMAVIMGSARGSALHTDARY